MDLEAIVSGAGGGRDARISEIFYFFENLTTLSSGRTVGRKIGVLQETVLRKYLEQSEELSRRMYLEQRLTGISGAGHKVEFSWYSLTPTLSRVGDVISDSSGLKVMAVDELARSVKIQTPSGRSVVLLTGEPSPRSGPLRTHLDAFRIDLRVRAVESDAVQIDVIHFSRLIASLESKRVGAQRFTGSDNLGAGIQTIEKAKQASLVAIDLDLAYNGNIKPLENGSSPKALISLVALGNGVHWTAKDKQVLGTYVDFTFLVKDASILRYVEYVRDLAGENVDFMEYFMSYFQGMTKQPVDGFEILDSDFSIIVPEEETRTLLQVIEDHILTVDPS